MALTEYDLDPVHSQLGFSVVHLMITRTHGVFTRWRGTFALDLAQPSQSRISVEIDAQSVDTRNPQRDEHLRSPDFFDAAQFPTIRFEAKEIVRTGDGLKLTGDFTLRGVTRPVTFAVTGGHHAQDSKGLSRVGYQATASINRKDFGVSWSKVYDGGSVVVANEVALELDLQLIPRG